MSTYLSARNDLFRYFFVCLLFALSASPISAQGEGSLTGTVTDDDSGESLPGVSLL